MIDYLDRLAALGCIVCRNEYGTFSPPEIHHIRHGMGMAQRNSDDNAIPLCPAHHRTGGYGVAYHAGAKLWQANFGTESELLRQVRELMK